MVDKVVGEVDIPLTYSTSLKCPICGNITEVEVEWGTSAAMGLAITPLACPKCGSKLN